MTYDQPKKNRTNLIAVLGIVAVLVVGGVIAIAVSTSGEDDDDKRTTAPTSTVNPADVRTAEVRDAALEDGRQAVETFNTLDHRHLDEDLDRWESAATGDLLAELRENREETATRIRQAKTTTTATVLDAALSDLDEQAGSARMLAAISVGVTVEGQSPTTKRTRIAVTLTRTGDKWKVSGIETV
jgi:Mce-associated membrane protein